MPSYELMLVFGRMNKVDLVKVLKRIGEGILEKDGILRKIEFLGHKQLPYKMANRAAPDKLLSMGSYFLYHFDSPPYVPKELSSNYKLDTEVVRAKITLKEAKLVDHVCTLDDELKPPSYRPSVLKLIDEGVKKKEPYDIGCKEF